MSNEAGINAGFVILGHNDMGPASDRYLDFHRLGHYRPVTNKKFSDS